MKAMKANLLKKPQNNKMLFIQSVKGTSPRQQQQNINIIQGLEWIGLADEGMQDPAFKGKISFVGVALSGRVERIRQPCPIKREFPFQS